MRIRNTAHLTYCANIHAGEQWQVFFSALKNSVPPIKKKIAPHRSFGLGLRFSDISSREILRNDSLKIFQEWLRENDLYVFTINGFVFGGFHNVIVKDNVHSPDWTTIERVEYTSRMFRILSQLLPEGIDGGISTSPLSYKHWYKNNTERENAFTASAKNIRIIAQELHAIKMETGNILHLDIEPEADGLIENSDEVVEFFQKYLSGDNEEIIREHIRLCYDVCHFAVGYERPQEVIKKISDAGIHIGKVQISAALKILFSAEREEREKMHALLRPFAESSYLHQTIEKKLSGKLLQYQDLPAALANISHTDAKEWRIHYHIPVFMNSCGAIESTQEDILELFRCVRKKNFTNHCEVETYTWEVLPLSERLPLEESIVRELEWTVQHLQ